ncbi:uncharacterized protein PHALS_05976 [Plasmopara halstedii]|uniref:Uncharacterized protein n=1 Tax=Plasmopara halstedii TaxID=4781 RepID=A0A0P1AC59_PLAHL|nr:uncharacterized protein PHALS_05976 [Plasmopara halstedii]CEG37930.1 hypothetical protein PHALS_05976 [Plasmopara halstedii]|eukprot:XP_024574299.1 hypothetical protein PHALS_05976 [Plasmopara halstedii]
MVSFDKRLIQASVEAQVASTIRSIKLFFQAHGTKLQHIMLAASNRRPRAGMCTSRGDTVD